MPQPKSIGLNERQVTLSSKTRRGVKGRLTPFKTLVVELRGEGADNDEGESSEVEDFDKAAEWHDCSAFQPRLELAARGTRRPEGRGRGRLDDSGISEEKLQTACSLCDLGK